MAKKHRNMVLFEAVSKAQKKNAGPGVFGKVKSVGRKIPTAKKPPMPQVETAERTEIVERIEKIEKTEQALTAETADKIRAQHMILPPHRQAGRWPKQQNKVIFGVQKAALRFPYKAVIIILLVAAGGFGVFKAGSAYLSSRAERIESDGGIPPADSDVTSTSAGTDVETGSGVVSSGGSSSGDATFKKIGDHVIIIKTYLHTDMHLKPAQEYFARNGIETEIQQKGSYYYLVTKDKYSNPEKEGTDGFDAMKRIKEVGAGYEAPAGFEGFKVRGKPPFQDAYADKL